MARIISTYQTILFLLFIFSFCAIIFAQSPAIPDTTIIFTPSNPNLIQPQNYRPMSKALGLDVLMSNNGFGLGMFYRYEIDDEYSFTTTLAISDVSDDSEIEQYDFWGNSFIPGKQNRLLLIPVMASVQYRLFKDDIVDNFRPFITAGLGPTMVFVSPYLTGAYDILGEPIKRDFFTSLKFGKMHYTVGGFIGAGLNFGIDRGTLTALSVKYFIAPFPNGIQDMTNVYIKNFGGLFLTLTFGSIF